MLQRTERHLSSLLQASRQGSGSAVLARSLAASSEPTLPPEFTWRDYTIFLLTIAAQIEHSLMVQCLYAAYSLGGPQVPEKDQNTVAGWRQLILGIAKEEMGHLATVQNALRFLGAPLALDRQDYPWDSQLAPYPFALERLSLSSLARYILAESPQTWPADVTAAERTEIETLAATNGGGRVNRVGVLYEQLAEIVANVDRIPTHNLHPETFPMQASWDEWGRGYGSGARGSSVAGTKSTPDVLILRMSSRSTMQSALRQIAEQGEAPAETTDNEQSHFRRFLRIFRGFPAMAPGTRCLRYRPIRWRPDLWRCRGNL